MGTKKTDGQPDDRIVRPSFRCDVCQPFQLFPKVHGGMIAWRVSLSLSLVALSLSATCGRRGHRGVSPIGQGDDDVPVVDVHQVVIRHADILARLMSTSTHLADGLYLPAYGGGKGVEQVSYLGEGHPYFFLRVALHAHVAVLVYSDMVLLMAFRVRWSDK